ncbi:hypothetical protein [Chthonomonas calidirosea]|uniref:hypothetical protein n=1 Tax=Chthonomonas calidirosea TaxID=454171 RepID=UPI0006EC91F9|nr:hypothetical protein [Chthonomonas calidirosea]CEK16677.1 hypothetical protein CP488_01589 [Chthonomonas calidirosea]
MKPIVFSSFCLLFIGWQAPAIAPSSGGKTPPVASPKTTKKRSSNIVQGSILQLTAETLTLHVGGGTETVRLSDQTHYWRNRQAVTRDAFKEGQTVIAHLRRFHGESQRLVVDLADLQSWRWLQHLRRDIVEATFESATEDQLQVRPNGTGADITYGLSSDTLWGIKGSQVPANPFHTGDQVWIVPRARSDGSMLARAVADTHHQALLLKEQLATTLRGKIVAVDSQAHTFVLQTELGERRTLNTPTPSDATHERASRLKTLEANELKPGLLVTVHLQHKRDGTVRVRSVTLQISKRRQK